MIIPYLLKIILRGAAIKNGNCYIISARGSSSRRLWPPKRQTLDWKVDCELPYEFYGKERSPELTANKYKAGFEQLRHWTTWAVTHVDENTNNHTGVWRALYERGGGAGVHLPVRTGSAFTWITAFLSALGKFFAWRSASSHSLMTYKTGKHLNLKS